MARPRDRQGAARAIEAFLRALGHDLEGELAGTPGRVADAWIDELLEGEGLDPLEILRSGSIEVGGAAGVVVLRDIAVSTMCPHHLLPGHGLATVGYLPDGKLAGLGALSGAVHALSRRLALQETLGEDIARALVDGLGAHGAFCRLELTHTCFVSRGERQSGSVLSTLALAGSFADRDRDLALATLDRPRTVPPAENR